MFSAVRVLRAAICLRGHPKFCSSWCAADTVKLVLGQKCLSWVSAQQAGGGPGVLQWSWWALRTTAGPAAVSRPSHRHTDILFCFPSLATGPHSLETSKRRSLTWYSWGPTTWDLWPGILLLWHGSLYGYYDCHSVNKGGRISPTPYCK